MYDAVLESSVEGTHEVCAVTLESSFKKWKQCSKNTRSILEKQFEVIINEIVFFLLFRHNYIILDVKFYLTTK